MRILSILGACAVLVSPLPEAFAQPAGAELQDWSGTWNMSRENFGPGKHDPYGTCCAGKGEWVPFTPKYRKLRDDFAKLPEYTVAKNTDNHADCISGGVPGELEHPGRFEFLITPGRVTYIDEIGTIRRIWTDGRHFPPKIEPSLQGYSIGHWENGRTLVVETRFISPQADLFMVGPLKATTQTHVKERFFVKDGMHLEVQVTVTDPQIFTRPYIYQRTFKKLPGTFEVGDCALYNRDTGHGTVDLTPPPDVVSPPPK